PSPEHIPHSLAAGAAGRVRAAATAPTGRAESAARSARPGHAVEPVQLERQRAGARGLAPHVAPFAGDHVAVARAVERVGPALTLVAADPDPPHLIAEPAQVIGPA